MMNIQGTNNSSYVIFIRNTESVKYAVVTAVVSDDKLWGADYVGTSL